ncbi:MAG: DUF3305 domain-containing protein [Alphaproteobacteria bacterium]|nr:MAG: DUF3305 domain-containing protein [Alphaproteobacteria bacterium]
MSPAATPLLRIPVGVVVARHKAASQWIDYTWAPVAVLHGVPETAPWTVLRHEGDATMYYAGSADVDLYRSETTFYRDNLASGAPSLWVVMTPAEAEPPYRLVAVTADPAEGEGFTETAANLVERVPMPDSIQQIVAAFVAEHHVERQFFKRKRDRQDTESLARRGYGDHDD